MKGRKALAWELFERGREVRYPVFLNYLIKVFAVFMVDELMDDGAFGLKVEQFQEQIFSFRRFEGCLNFRINSRFFPRKFSMFIKHWTREM